MNFFKLKALLLTPYVNLMRIIEKDKGGIVKGSLEHFSYSPTIYRFLRDVKSKYPCESDGPELQDSIYDYLSDGNLNETSIAFDLGAFHGHWASKIQQKYGSKVYVFEPNPRAFRKLQQRFEGKSGFRLYQFGLSDKDSSAQLAMHGEGSNIYKPDPHGRHDREIKMADIQLFAVSEFLKKEKIATVDFAKINIEGGEFDLLEHLINTGEISNFKILNIQFHEWLPKAIFRRRAIRKALRKTHHNEWNYAFMWERWVLKE